MKFRTEIQPLPHKGLITHHDKILLLGSCFSDSIGEKLTQRLFNTLINPFGPLYNAAAIHNAVNRIARGKLFTINDLHRNKNGLWFCYECHTKLSCPDADEMLRNLNSLLTQARDFLRQATTICVTLGTAWVYESADTHFTVANCHKQPAELFRRYRQSPAEIAESLSGIINIMREYNPLCHVILTVSPIRHLADGLHGNQLSKASLLLACEESAEANDNVIYFPSYEIMMDDLRSYRFYAPDMKHPDEVAVDYIFDIFSRSFFSEATVRLGQQGFELWQRLHHRHITSDTSAHIAFDNETQHMAHMLTDTYPEIRDVLSKNIDLQ